MSAPVEVLSSPVRSYEWGAVDVLPRLLGAPPDGRPQAELWVGAHPDSPSLVHGPAGPVALDALVAGDPDAALGRGVRERFGDRLPYLLKLLAVARPVSLQVHPDAAQAAAGVARERAAGVPRRDFRRCYPDGRHKPEMVLALTPFEALVGLREPAEVLAALDGLDVAGLDDLRAALSASDPAQAVHAALSTLLRGGPRSRALVDALAAACAARLGSGSEHAVLDATVCELAAAHPGDVGVAVSLLLHRVRLRPGEAVLVPPRTLHAYLSGTAAEVMASSDDVLRGALTSKHVDVDELLAVVDPVPRRAAGVPAQELAPGLLALAPDVAEFALLDVRPAGSAVEVPGAGPRTVLALEGTTAAATGSGRPAGQRVPLRPGAGVFVADSDGPLRLEGDGRVLVVGVPSALGVPPRPSGST